MVAIKLPTFAGMVPSVDEHLLSDQQAAFAQNTWLYSGALAGLPEMIQLHTMADPLAEIAFRVPNNEGDPTYLYDSFWMEFQNAGTDFISGPVSADSWRRFYWTSSSQVPKYNTLARMIAGQPAWLLGLPQPGNLSVVATGGSSSNIVSRAYVTTLVTEYGEEGPASTPFLINGKEDASFDVTIAGVAAADMGTNRNVKKIRLYRTIVSAQGTATYYRVTERTALTTTQVVNDTISDVNLANNPILESTAWTAPPDLDGLVTMPNGIVAGFKGNELWFSAPYMPHAWPVAYSLTVEFEIVGLAVVGQTLVCCTKGNPITASGVNPANITTSKIATFEPCLSKGSIIPTEEGVYYTSPNGLILVNAGYAQNITKQYISRDKWSNLVNLAKVNAGRMGGAYYAFGTGVQAVFQSNAFQNDFAQVSSVSGSGDGFLLDPQNANVGFSFLYDTFDIKSVKNDMFSGEVLVVKNSKVYWLDQRTGYTAGTFKWKSKVFQTPDHKNFAAFKLYLYDPVSVSFPNPQNFDTNQVFNPATQICVVRIYADGNLVSAREVRSSGELHRLPSGFKADFWQVEIEARVKIKSFQMATSVKELSVV